MLTESHPRYQLHLLLCILQRLQIQIIHLSSVPRLQGTHIRLQGSSLVRLEMKKIEPCTSNLKGVGGTHRQQLSPKNFFHTPSTPNPSPFCILYFAEGFEERRYGLRSVSCSHWHSSDSQRIGHSVKMKPEVSNFNVFLCNMPRFWESEASILEKVQIVNPDMTTSKESYLALRLRNALCILSLIHSKRFCQPEA